MVAVNHLAFELTLTDSGYWVAVPLIDGVPFPKLIEPVEKVFAEREGHPALAGKYAGPLLINIGDPNDYFFGRSRFTHKNGKTPVLECDCGVEGCWPLLAEITVDADQIRWGQFEQLHRTASSPSGHWTYEGLDDLVFSREGYVTALNTLANEIRNKSHD